MITMSPVRCEIVFIAKTTQTRSQTRQFIISTMIWKRVLQNSDTFHNWSIINIIWSIHSSIAPLVCSNKNSLHRWKIFIFVHESTVKMSLGQKMQTRSKLLQNTVCSTNWKRWCRPSPGYIHEATCCQGRKQRQIGITGDSVHSKRSNVHSATVQITGVEKPARTNCWRGKIHSDITNLVICG